MATTAPGIPLVWTTGADEQGVRLEYTATDKYGITSSGWSACLQPGSSRVVASNPDLQSCTVTAEDIRKRPKVTVTMRSDPPGVALASGGLELWCRISGISCSQVTTSGRITLTYDGAKWTPADEHEYVWPDSRDSGLIQLSKDVVAADFSGLNTAYSGDIHAEEAVISFVKTRERVTVSATNGRATMSPDPLPPGSVPDISFSGYEWGTDVTLAANDPDECCIFDHWEYTGSGEDPHGIHGNTSSTVTLTALPNYEYESGGGYSYMYRDTSYRAVYRKKQVTLTVAVFPQGAAQAPDPEVHDCGSSWRPTAPSPTDPRDYQFDQWSDGEMTLRHSRIYPTSDTTLTAVYVRIDHHLLYGRSTGQLLFNGDLLLWAGLRRQTGT